MTWNGDMAVFIIVFFMSVETTNREQECVLGECMHRPAENWDLIIIPVLAFFIIWAAHTLYRGMVAQGSKSEPDL